MSFALVFVPLHKVIALGKVKINEYLFCHMPSFLYLCTDKGAEISQVFGAASLTLSTSKDYESFEESLRVEKRLSKSEVHDLKSKILISKVSDNNHRGTTKVFTERGLYMLATILKGEKARNVTFAIIETFAKVRELKRELLELHKETDKEKQKTKMQHFGEVLTDIVMSDLQTQETESSLEINFLIGKIKHTVKRVRKEDSKQ